MRLAKVLRKLLKDNEVTSPHYVFLKTANAQYDATITALETQHKSVWPDNNLSVVLSDDNLEALVKVDMRDATGIKSELTLEEVGGSGFSDANVGRATSVANAKHERRQLDQVRLKLAQPGYSKTRSEAEIV